MVTSRTVLLLAAAITHTVALPFDSFFQQLGRRASPSYSVINVDGSNGSNPTGSIQTVTTTVTITAVPEAAAVKTVFVTAPAVTVTAALAESTSWYDDGMWHTSYFTRIALTQPAAQAASSSPAAQAASSIPTSILSSSINTFSLPSSAPAAPSVTPSSTP